MRLVSLLKKFALILGVVVCIFGSSLTLADEITHQPDGTAGTDVWVTSTYYGGGLDNEEIRSGGWGDSYYGLIKFDLTGLPPVATSAKILLYAYPFADTRFTPISMYLDRVTSSWTESTKWSGKPSYANLGTISAPASNNWYEIDVTSLYNSWQDGTYVNHGIQLRPTSVNAKMTVFRSSDYTTDVTLRPKLVVKYENYSCSAWQ